MDNIFKIKIISISLLFLVVAMFSTISAAEDMAKWKFKTTGGIESTPTVDVNGTLYVGSSDSFYMQ